MKSSKNTAEIRAKVLALLCDGYSQKEACLRCGISIHSLIRYQNQSKEFKSQVKKAEKMANKSLIKDSLNELAKGVDKTEETREYYEVENEGQPNERKVRVSIKTRRLPPDIKALRMLAYKHAKGEYEDSEKDMLGLEIRITSRDRGLSIEERLELVRKDSEAIEIIEDAIEVDAKLNPPTEESEG